MVGSGVAEGVALVVGRDVAGGVVRVTLDRFQGVSRVRTVSVSGLGGAAQGVAGGLGRAVRVEPAGVVDAGALDAVAVVAAALAEARERVQRAVRGVVAVAGGGAVHGTVKCWGCVGSRYFTIRHSATTPVIHIYMLLMGQLAAPHRTLPHNSCRTLSSYHTGERGPLPRDKRRGARQ